MWLMCQGKLPLKAQVGVLGLKKGVKPKDVDFDISRSSSQNVRSEVLVPERSII